MDPIVEGLLKDVALLKQKFDNLIRPEVPLGLSLAAAPQILTGTAAIITFSGIVQTYKNLLLIAQIRTDRVAEADSIRLRFNGDSSAIYDRQILTVTNATLTGLASRAQTSIQVGTSESANSRASNFSPMEVTIYGYARTDAEKWILSSSAVFGDVSVDGDLSLQTFAGRWRNTAAITSLNLTPGTGPNFVAGCEFYLYGIK